MRVSLRHLSVLLMGIVIPNTLLLNSTISYSLTLVYVIIYGNHLLRTKEELLLVLQLEFTEHATDRRNNLNVC